MSRNSFNVDPNYRKIATPVLSFRDSVRAAVHPPHRRATTRPLFYTGCVAVGIALLILFRH